MGKAVRRQGRLNLCAVEAAIGFIQPRLSAEATGQGFLLRGDFLVFESGAISNPAGPLTSFEIALFIPDNFPRSEPVLIETGGRIPRKEYRHINPDGDCCVTVWEHWLMSAAELSIAGYLNGPVNEYFLGQYWYEKKGEWPFGERSHGRKGLVEAYADLLGVPPRERDLTYRLRLLAQDWPKGHWQCPCGSGRKLRLCHREAMMELHQKIPPRMARRMLLRLRSQG